MPPSSFYAYFVYFVHVLRNRSLKPKFNLKGLKIELFSQKIFFETHVRSHKFYLTHAPPFENFSLDALNSEQKPSVKKPVDRAGQLALTLKFSGRVGKIQTGSISEL